MKGLFLFLKLLAVRTRQGILEGSAIKAKLLLTFALASLAQAAPFGIEPGSALPELVELEEPRPYTYSHAGLYYVKPPKPHPDFAFYSVVWHRDHGVCAVRADSAIFPIDAAGKVLSGKFRKIRDQIRYRYDDFSYTPGANDEVNWHQGYWYGKESQRVRSIELMARLDRRDTGLLLVQFKFWNNDKCVETRVRDEIKAEREAVDKDAAGAF